MNQVDEKAVQVAYYQQGLTKMSPEFEKILGKQIDVEKFTRIALTAIQNNTDLLFADKQSVFNAVMRCAQDGLLPDGREAVIAMFKGKATYLPMVAGVLKKIPIPVTTRIIYENEAFKFWIDDNGAHVNHTPIIWGERGKPLGVYAFGKMPNGQLVIETLSEAEVAKVRDSSPAKNSPAWRDWWDEMAKKSAIKRLSKYVKNAESVADLFDSFESQFVDENSTGTVTNSAPVVKSIGDLGKSPERQIEPPKAEPDSTPQSKNTPSINTEPKSNAPSSDTLPETFDGPPERDETSAAQTITNSSPAAPQTPPSTPSSAPSVTDPKPKETASKTSAPLEPPKPAGTNSQTQTLSIEKMTRPELTTAAIDGMQRLGWNAKKFAEFVKKQYKKEANLLTDEEMRDCVEQLRARFPK